MKWSSLKLALIAVISMAQILVLCFYIAYKNLNLVLGSWSDSTSLTIYLKTDSTDDDKGKLINMLESVNPESEIIFVSRSQAAKDFQKSIGSYASGLFSEDELIDLVPESIELFPSKNLALNEKLSFFETVSKRLLEMPQVEESVFGSNWLQRFSKIDTFLKYFGYAAFFILLLAMGFLSALMVRVLIDDSKNEIEVFNLLGATRWSIYKTFLKDICMTISLSLILSFTLSYFLFASLKAALVRNQLGQFLTDKLIFLDAREAGIFSFLVILFILLISLNTMTAALKKLSHLSYD